MTSRSVAKAIRALKADTKTTPGPVEDGSDVKTVAQSLTLAVTGWISGGIEWGYDWRPGLERVIRLHLHRLNTIPPNGDPEVRP